MSQLVPIQERVKTVRSLLERSKPQIAMALPKHMDADRLMRVAMTSIQRTPKLLECDQVSLLGAIIQSAQLGLEPDGVLGEAYLVPFGRQVQFIAGYKGLLKLARQSGEISTIEARVVREKDAFSYRYGLTPTLEHQPTSDPEPGHLTHVYCVVRMKDSGVQWEVMTRAEVDAVRKRSRAAESGPWVTDYEAMALKTVARRTLKWCPASTQLARAVALDERAEAGLSQDVEAVITADALAVEEKKPDEKGTGKALDALTERLKTGEQATLPTEGPEAA